jgi:aminoglycoside phosphotransferase (APT) family kinase protein
MTQPDTAPVRPGEELDWAAIDRYLHDHIHGLTGELEVEQFPGGSANLTYLLRYGDQEFVLRRPPFGVIAPGAHDMKREYKVLSQLWKYTRLAPRAFAFCDDRAVCGADFFVMERRRGVVVRSEMPEALKKHRDVGRRIGFAVVDAMAELHGLDPVACGLGDLGKPEGFAARQVAGWAKRWSLVRPPNDDGLMDRIAARLASAVPTSERTSFVHNDLKPDNLQFDPEDPDHARSIFDWDMTTLGDPMIDLGTLVQYWPDGSDPDFASLTSQPGMLDLGLPSRAEIVARYAAVSKLSMESLPWWVAFAYWKTCVVVTQLHTRWLRGESKDPRMAVIGERGPKLAAKAWKSLDASN